MARAKKKPLVTRSAEEIQAALCSKYPDIDSATVAALLSDSDLSRASLKQVEAQLAFLDRGTKQLDILQDDSNYDSTLSEDAQSIMVTDATPSVSTSASASTHGSPSLSSNTSGYSTLSTIDFLQTAFPFIPPSIIRETVEEGSGQWGDEVDMEVIFEELLTKQLISDLEERGWDKEIPSGDPKDWAAVELKKGKRKASGMKPSVPKAKGKTTLLVDIRQRQHHVPSSSASQSQGSHLWVQLDSLAIYLSDLLQPLQPSYFLSLFHNPKYGDPSNAVRHELDSIAQNSHQSLSDTSLDASLSMFIEILPSTSEGILQEDAARCLRATHCDFDHARQLYLLLVELDQLGPVISHSASTPLQSPLLPHSSRPAVISSPKAQAPPIVTKPAQPNPSDASKGKNLKRDWTVVTHRSQPRTIALDPLGESIPAYRNMPEGWRSRAGRLATEREPTREDEGSEFSCREWASHYQSKRDDALRSASQNWKARGMAGRGEVAFYYAQRAREYEQESRSWSVKAARAMVKDSQRKSNKPNTLDLHGVTVHEAITLVKESLNDWWNSAGADVTPSRPFVIITGQGNHSKSRVSVIGPAVANFLEREGWKATKQAGSITVTGIAGQSTRR